MSNSVYKINKGINKPVEFTLESTVYMVSRHWTFSVADIVCSPLYHRHQHLCVSCTYNYSRYNTIYACL